MNQQARKRPPRTQKTPEEIAELKMMKRIKEFRRVSSFKKTRFYKVCNIFNVICFFIYLELIICYFGPANYRLHFSKQVDVNFGEARKDRLKETSSISFTDVNDKTYELMVNEFIEAPEKYSVFNIGSDFLFGKEIKGSIAGSEQEYRIHKAGPLLFLSFFLLITG